MFLIELRRFFDAVPDVALDDAGLTGRFSNGRAQRIDVRPVDGVIELRSVVARRTVTEQIECVMKRLMLVAWEHNRASGLVGFRVDDRGRLLGECWVPMPGLTREEFLLYVGTVALECDRFEFQLTGNDRE